MKFTKDGIEYEVTSKVTPTYAFCKRVGQRGRPAKMLKSDVEALVGQPLEVTAEDKAVKVVSTPVVTETAVVDSE